MPSPLVSIALKLESRPLSSAARVCVGWAWAAAGLAGAAAGAAAVASAGTAAPSATSAAIEQKRMDTFGFPLNRNWSLKFTGSPSDSHGRRRPLYVGAPTLLPTELVERKPHSA